MVIPYASMILHKLESFLTSRHRNMHERPYLGRGLYTHVGLWQGMHIAYCFLLESEEHLF